MDFFAITINRLGDHLCEESLILLCRPSSKLDLLPYGAPERNNNSHGVNCRGSSALRVTRGDSIPCRYDPTILPFFVWYLVGTWEYKKRIIRFSKQQFLSYDTYRDTDESGRRALERGLVIPHVFPFRIRASAFLSSHSRFHFLWYASDRIQSICLSQ